LKESHTLIHHLVEEARAGTLSNLICRVPSGWAVLNDQQVLRGYCLLLPDPVVDTLNDLNGEQRTSYLNDMTLIGDVLLEITNSHRINYAILGNSEPALHAHIIPRYLDEPEALRKGPFWSYPPEIMNSKPFHPGRDHDLIEKLAAGLQKHLAKLHL
jgi:diadenosine tetraphosphate (Ap4A) HIT family hydrolase